MLAIGTLLGWTMHKVREQRVAIAALEKLGCGVACGVSFADEAEPPPTLLQRLRSFLGEDPSDVLVVMANDSQLDDAAMRLVGSFPRPGSLWMRGTNVSDAGVAQLANLVNLEYLDASSTRLTDAGMRHLGGLPKLSYLSLSGTQVGDSGLAQLLELQWLSYLDLSNTHVGDAGLVHLIALESPGPPGPIRNRRDGCRPRPSRQA